MHYFNQYLEKKPMSKSSINQNGSVNKFKISLYCNFYSFYSQKVLMAMYEKQIEFETLEIDITKGEQYSPWFLEINPRGEIPVLKVNDSIIPDSTRILDYLESHLDPALPSLIEVSDDDKVLDRINKFRDMIEALPAGVITVGSFFHPHLCGKPKLPFIQPVREVLKNGDLSNSDNLRKLAKENPKAKDVLLYKAEIQDRKRDILLSEDEYMKVLDVVDQVLSDVEDQLLRYQHGWLCSDLFTIADINLAVLLQRLWELGLEDRFWSNGKRPKLANYFKTVQQRESFKRTIPTLPLHLKMIITSQPPLYIGAAGAASIAVVFAFVLILKKIVF